MNNLLINLFIKDIKLMADRILEMRSSLKKSIIAAGSKKDWEHITN